MTDVNVNLNLRISLTHSKLLKELCRLKKVSESRFVRGAIKYQLLRNLKIIDEEMKDDFDPKYKTFIQLFEEATSDKWKYEKSDWFPRQEDF